ncbi:MAG: porin, partial [Sphingomonadaceae bacterium]
PCPNSLLHGLGVGAAMTYGHDYGTLATPELPTYRTQGQTAFVQYPTGPTLATTAVADGMRWRADVQGHLFVGRFGALSEYARSAQHVVLGANVGNVIADAWMIEAQWVLTGEDATYASVVPRAPFEFARRQWGAVDVVVRYDVLRVQHGAFSEQLLDPSKAARRTRGYSIGADWFASTHVRVTLDAERTTFRLGFAGGTNRPDETVMTARLQVVF